MPELTTVPIAFVLMCASAALGMFVRERLPEHHRSRETTEMMQVTISLLVTFAALVLGLLTASVKQAYDKAAHDRQEYALQLTLLDQCLRNYGPETAAARGQIHSYTAAVIASTWPSEPRPVGVQYPDTQGMPRVGASPVLGSLIDKVGVEISRLPAVDVEHTRMVELCLDRYKTVVRARLGVVEDARVHLFDPFYEILLFWLMITFACFGLIAPRNRVAIITIMLCAISLSTVLFVIQDLSHPYEGVFSISSQTMRTALKSMLSPPQ